MTGRKILLVDADPATLKYLGEALRREGYEALLAPSGKEGLVAAWRDLPDVILVDPVLPDISGEELAARLRAEPRTVHVPLVALSSDNRPGRRQTCIDAGYTDFLVKSPQLLASLRETLTGIVSGAQSTDRQGASCWPSSARKVARARPLCVPIWQ